MGGHRVLERAGDGGECGQEHDGVGATNHVVEQAAIQDAALDQLCWATVEIGPRAGREVVQGDDDVDLRGSTEMTAQVGTDEPGAPGHDDAHPPPSLVPETRRQGSPVLAGSPSGLC